MRIGRGGDGMSEDQLAELYEKLLVNSWRVRFTMEMRECNTLEDFLQLRARYEALYKSWRIEGE